MIKALLPALLLLIILSGCSLFEKKDEVVATVNKDKLTLSELKADFTDAGWKALTAEQKKAYAQEWVNLTLLSQEADKQGIGKDPQIKLKLKYAEMKIKGNALIASRLATQNITEEDMFNYYRIHQGEFSKSMLNYKVQRIFLTDHTMIDKVQQELDNGMKFEDAARLYSREPLGTDGGFMGIAAPEDADTTFWAAVHNLKLFETTVITKDKGWYLLRPYEEVPGTGGTGFEALKDQIRSRMLEERRQQVYDDLMKELRSKSDVFLMI